MSKCALYRHFDAEGALLYVGISLRPFTRTSQHVSLAPWADQIANVKIEYFPTRSEAMAAEARAVQEENPLHNIMLRKKKPKLQKKEQRLREVTETRATAARNTLTQRVLNFAPLYKPADAAAALGIHTSVLNREIADGNLATILIPSTKPGKVNKYITGWQLIDWLESRELQEEVRNRL